MTFLELWNKISGVQEIELILRLLIACVCGAVIGGERTRRMKEAGVRTHVLVCCTAALLMVVSKYGFVDITGESGDSRIASQVVNGISFLCAGVIFKNGSGIKGLTTAAGIWATAAVGLALGSGMYWLGLLATGIVMALQTIMHHFIVGNDAFLCQNVTLTVHDSKDFMDELDLFIQDLEGVVEHSHVCMNRDGVTTYKMKVWIKKNIEIKEEWQLFMEAHQEISVLEYAGVS